MDEDTKTLEEKKEERDKIEKERRLENMWDAFRPLWHKENKPREGTEAYKNAMRLTQRLRAQMDALRWRR